MVLEVLHKVFQHELSFSENQDSIISEKQIFSSLQYVEQMILDKLLS